MAVKKKEMKMPIHSVKVTSVSWINRSRLEQYAAMPGPFDDWVRGLAYGLRHTSNIPPPLNIDGSRASGAHGGLNRQYRGLVHFELKVHTEKGQFVSALVDGSCDIPVLDPGFTPPFDQPDDARTGARLRAMVEALAKDVSGGSDLIAKEAFIFSPGQRSSLSHVKLPQKNQRVLKAGLSPLPYSSLRAIIPANEILLGNGIIKFRAGSVGNTLGILALDSPRHLPWVWCESAVTYANNKLTLYGSGSAFPSHAFYLNGTHRQLILASCDSLSLRRFFESGKPANPHPTLFNQFTGQYVTRFDPQNSVYEPPYTSPLEMHAYTAKAAPQVVKIQIPLDHSVR